MHEENYRLQLSLYSDIIGSTECERCGIDTIFGISVDDLQLVEAHRVYVIDVHGHPVEQICVGCAQYDPNSRGIRLK